MTAKEDDPTVADDAEGVQTTNNSKFSYAQLFVKNIRCGWNLGNTFDATSMRGNTLADTYTVNDLETGWGNPTTTKAMIDTVKAAGFNAVRIPVSWCRFITEKNGKYSIRADYLKRVKEVVDYAYNNSMYVIINMHHDDNKDEWLSIWGSDSEFKQVKDEFPQLWKIIANYFKAYNSRLVFEAMNEPISHADGEDDWWGHDYNMFARLSELYKLFVTTVRATGGNNKTRMLMIPTYGAQSNGHQLWSMIIPDDDRLIVDVHYYTESADVNSLKSRFETIKSFSEEYNVPVIIGECGITAGNTTENKVKWAKAYVKTATEYGLPCFIWDDGGNYQVLCRSECTWQAPEFIEAYVSSASKK